MAWTKWALVPQGVVGKRRHYWGFPEEVKPDGPRRDMPAARILLIDETDDDRGAPEVTEQMKREVAKTVAEWRDRGSNVIVEESEDDDVSLYRYGEDGEFAGDTLHDNLDAALEQANWEYDALLDWHDVPTSLGRKAVDQKMIRTLLRSLPK